MKYIRTKDGCILETLRESGSKKSYITKPYGWVIHKKLIVKEADVILDLIEKGDIIFYYDFHSQSKQMMYVLEPESVKYINITKLLLPYNDDYKCVAKAEHEYKVLANMKYVIKKGELKLV